MIIIIIFRTILQIYHFFSSEEPLMLTPYIESGNAVEGRLASRVTDPLEGLKRDQMVESYSGFLTVNKEPLRNSFFWFFPAMVRQIKIKIKLNMIILVQFDSI
jgi:hypothetical protein